MTEERCVFPYSQTCIFEPIRDFPWYAERIGQQGNDILPWEKWIINIEKDDDHGGRQKIRIPLKTVVRKILAGRKITSGITVRSKKKNFKNQLF